MIERLLAAEKALDQGMLDTAGRLYAQVAHADPRNAIALVGLAKVALREDRIDDARELAEQALAIDPDEAAAQRLLREAYAEMRPAAERRPALESRTESTSAPAAPAPAAAPAAGPEPSAPEVPVPDIRAPEVRIARDRSLLDRLRRWLFGPRDGS